MHFPSTRSHRHLARRDLSFLSFDSDSSRLIKGTIQFFSRAQDLGSSEKYTHLPSLRSWISPAFLRVLRWAETSGCETPRMPSSSHTQRSRFRRRERILSRLVSVTIFIKEKISIGIRKIGQAGGRPPARLKLVLTAAARWTRGVKIHRPSHNRDSCNCQRAPHGFFHGFHSSVGLVIV